MASAAPSSSSSPSTQASFQETREFMQSLKARQDDKRTRPEKIADWMTGIFGSMWFLISNLIVFGGWLAVNVNVIPGIKPFDPFPFGLLTTIVSLEAIGLAIIVLMSQNRSAKIAELREEVDLQVDMLAERELTKLMHILCAVAEKLDIDVGGDPELTHMLEPTSMERIETELEKQVIGSEKPTGSEKT